MVLNERLLESMGDDATQEQAFAHANDVLKNEVGGIIDIIHIRGLENGNFEVVMTVSTVPGLLRDGRPDRLRPGTTRSRGPKRRR